MKEIFENIPQTVRERTQFWIDLSFAWFKPEEGAKMLNDYRNSLKTEEEREYLDFCFSARMEEGRQSKQRYLLFLLKCNIISIEKKGE